MGQSKLELEEHGMLKITRRVDFKFQYGEASGAKSSQNGSLFWPILDLGRQFMAAVLALSTETCYPSSLYQSVGMEKKGAFR